MKQDIEIPRLGDHLVQKVFKELEVLERANKKTSEYMEAFKTSTDLSDMLFNLDRLVEHTRDQKVVQRNIQHYEALLNKELLEHKELYTSNITESKNSDKLLSYIKATVKSYQDIGEYKDE